MKWVSDLIPCYGNVFPVLKNSQDQAHIYGMIMKLWWQTISTVINYYNDKLVTRKMQQEKW